MARTKQTAPKSTADKAPRKQLATMWRRLRVPRPLVKMWHRLRCTGDEPLSNLFACGRRHLPRYSSDRVEDCDDGGRSGDVVLRRYVVPAVYINHPLFGDAAEEFQYDQPKGITRFGQLQAVDLGSIEPSLRADAELAANPREDLPEIFENRDRASMIHT